MHTHVFIYSTNVFIFSSLHPNYIYHPSYLPTAAGLLPVTHTPINHAAALTAAGQQAYFDYTSAAAAYPGTYQTAAAASIEPYAAAAVSAGMAKSFSGNLCANNKLCMWSEVTITNPTCTRPEFETSMFLHFM